MQCKKSVLVWCTGLHKKTTVSFKKSHSSFQVFGSFFLAVRQLAVSELLRQFLRTCSLLQIRFFSVYPVRETKDKQHPSPQSEKCFWKCFWSVSFMVPGTLEIMAQPFFHLLSFVKLNWGNLKICQRRFFEMFFCTKGKPMKISPSIFH